MFHVKHFYSFSVGVSDQTKTAGVTHLVNVSLRMDTQYLISLQNRCGKGMKKRTALLPEMTKGNMTFAIACVLSDNSRFQGENDIKSMTKTIEIAL